jgi:hypothetical protein
MVTLPFYRCKILLAEKKSTYYSMPPYHNLVTSTQFLWIPQYLFVTNPEKNVARRVLATLLGINILVSTLFWSHPIPHSIIHHLDAFFGRLSGLVFGIYMSLLSPLSKKTRALFFILLFDAILAFYMSDYYSSRAWFCPEHINWHMLFHAFIAAGTALALAERS